MKMSSLDESGTQVRGDGNTDVETIRSLASQTYPGGKHEGETLAQVLDTDAGYLRYGAVRPPFAQTVRAFLDVYGAMSPDAREAAGLPRWGLAGCVRFFIGIHADETIGEVASTDRSFVEWTASRYAQSSIGQFCFAYLAETKDQENDLAPCGKRHGSTYTIEQYDATPQCACAHTWSDDVQLYTHL